jgi:hypothetical protein
MDPERHFHVQLYRQYPHLYKVVACLVEEYNNCLRGISDIKKDQGELEVEAMFGRLCYTTSTGRHFENSLPLDVINKIFTILCSFGEWDSISDWFIVYDYFTSQQERIRVSYENKVQKITRVTKCSLSHRDCAYQHPQKASDRNPDDWQLRDYLVRVNMKYESCHKSDEERVEFASVKLSVRKYFVLRSNSLAGVSFKFELIQFWTGKTIQEAEQKMKLEEPQCTFECEIINLPREQTLTNPQKFLLFTSLLLKMQDFLDIPTYTQLLHSHDSATPDCIPTFQLV